MIQVKNKKTGVKSSISQADFDKISQDNNWFNVFEVLPAIPDPKELAEKKPQTAPIVPNIGSVTATTTGSATALGANTHSGKKSEPKK